jgi:hypothetical protein
MTTAAFPVRDAQPRLLRAIVAGGAIAGALDLTSAFITFGLRAPRGIAAGLLGAQARSGGAGTWILGVFLHFFIAFSVATIYCLASRRLDFLKDHFLVCGMFFGIAIFLVMNLVVLPLCAFHFTGPYQLRGLLQGLIVHMLLIGLPIAYCAHKFE